MLESRRCVQTHHQAELCGCHWAMEGQHELPISLLALVALIGPQQPANHVRVQSECVISRYRESVVCTDTRSA